MLRLLHDVLVLQGVGWPRVEPDALDVFCKEHSLKHDDDVRSFVQRELRRQGYARATALRADASVSELVVALGWLVSHGDVVGRAVRAGCARASKGALLPPWPDSALRADATFEALAAAVRARAAAEVGTLSADASVDAAAHHCLQLVSRTQRVISRLGAAEAALAAACIRVKRLQQGRATLSLYELRLCRDSVAAERHIAALRASTQAIQLEMAAPRLRDGFYSWLLRGIRLTSGPSPDVWQGIGDTARDIAFTNLSADELIIRCEAISARIDAALAARRDEARDLVSTPSQPGVADDDLGAMPMQRARAAVLGVLASSSAGLHSHPFDASGHCDDRGRRQDGADYVFDGDGDGEAAKDVAIAAEDAAETVSAMLAQEQLEWRDRLARDVGRLSA